MCVLCDGLTEEEFLTRQYMRILVDGCTLVTIEGLPTWAYSIGLMQSFDHPELVVTGRTDTAARHLLPLAIERIRSGQRFEVSTAPLELCDCGPVAFGPVHPAQWERGRFNAWLNFYGWAGREPPAREMVQLLWSDHEQRFPPHPEFCCGPARECQPLLGVAPRHDVNTGMNRADRRRAKYGHGKRRRR